MIPIEWWYMFGGRPIFEAKGVGLILSSGATIKQVVVTETQVQDEVLFLMVKFQAFNKTPEGSNAWYEIEDRMKILTRYADKLGILDGLQFYGWFERHMGDMGLGCANIQLEPLQDKGTFTTNDYVKSLPVRFDCSTGRMIA
jgi:hypothetical protein